MRSRRSSLHTDADEVRHRELDQFFELSSDLMVIAGQRGLIRANPAFERIIGSTAGPSGLPIDCVAPEDQAAVWAATEALRDGHGPVRFECRTFCRDGVERWIEWIVVPRQGFFYAFGRDVSEQRREQEQLRRLAAQQEALRRVATLVASGVSPEEVFGAVAEEMVRCLNVPHAEVFRYHDEGAAIVIVACCAEAGAQSPQVGERLILDGDNVAAKVFRSRRPARMDSLDDATGPLAARMRELGMHSRVGAPIVVDERLWGLALIGSPQPEPQPADTEERIAEFADLVATAIDASTTREELVASRARIVTAADDARRRIERDLHDGAQQRLVALGLKLRMAEDSVPQELADVKAELSQAVSALNEVGTELQELSRGIHPSVLARGGLRPALQNLARRSAVPVALDVDIDRRLPEPAEVAAYYVVAEALTNADKHARATEVRITACLDDAASTLHVSIVDDGVGGADAGDGSGLVGLKDRVEALGGHFGVESRPGHGTALHIAVPVDRGDDDTC